MMQTGPGGFRKFLDNRAYHRRQRAKAARMLRHVKAFRGPINRHWVRLSDEYARDVLGWRGYAPWLYIYSAVSGRFEEGWIPDHYYGHVVIPKTKGLYGGISHLKSLGRRLFQSGAFPDLVYSINGFFYAPDFQPLPEAALKRVLFAGGERVVFKADYTRQGRNILVLSRDDFDSAQMRALGNGVFQGYVEQNELFGHVMPDCAATLRLTTVIDNAGQPSLRSAYIKFGRRGDTHVTVQRLVMVPVDLQTGAFAGEGHLFNWDVVDQHPDSGVKFSGLKIPDYARCVETVLDLHGRLPCAQCIGWDVIPDRHGEIQVLEWNGAHNAVSYPQATQGPCFGDLGWERLWRGEQPQRVLPPENPAAPASGRGARAAANKYKV